MFWNGTDVCDEPFNKRRGILASCMSLHVPISIPFDQREIDRGKKKGYEGFILRKKDGKITYTMNGKAKRYGSWKWKYEETDDFIVLDAEYGKGKHSKYFARFKLGQYDSNGEIIECGYCGTGKLTVPILEALHKERKASDGSYISEPLQVVEVLFRVRTREGKLEFPVLQRLRDDKKSEECIYNER
jgi:ATP-dependent DNA ligase